MGRGPDKLPPEKGAPAGVDGDAFAADHFRKMARSDWPRLFACDDAAKRAQKERFRRDAVAYLKEVEGALIKGTLPPEFFHAPIVAFGRSLKKVSIIRILDVAQRDDPPRRGR
jgi:hypothetical protein